MKALFKLNNISNKIQLANGQAEDAYKNRIFKGIPLSTRKSCGFYSITMDFQTWVAHHKIEII